jgi:hypothetical protein
MMPVISCRLAIGAIAAAMVLGMSAEAQSSAACTLGIRNYIGFGMMGGYGAVGRSVAPFSATVKTTFEQKLPDGNSIHGYTRTRQARDSAGKTLSEFAQSCQRGEDGQPHLMSSVSVYDRTAKTTMNWQVNGNSAKVVRVMHQGEQIPPPVPSAELLERQKIAQVQQPPRSEFRTDKLGTKTINGLSAEGSRTVRTIPAGEEGNELPLEVIDESWRSRELGLTLMMIKDDPRQGRTVVEFEELSLAEPDPALFAAPAGYKVEDVHPNIVAAGLQ